MHAHTPLSYATHAHTTRTTLSQCRTCTPTTCTHVHKRVYGCVRVCVHVCAYVCMCVHVWRCVCVWRLTRHAGGVREHTTHTAAHVCARTHCYQGVTCVWCGGVVVWVCVCVCLCVARTWCVWSKCGEHVWRSACVCVCVVACKRCRDKIRTRRRELYKSINGGDRTLDLERVKLTS